MEASLPSAQMLGIAAACVALIILSVPIILLSMNARLAHQNRLLKKMLCVLDPDGSKWRYYESRHHDHAKAHKTSRHGRRHHRAGTGIVAGQVAEERSPPPA